MDTRTILADYCCDMWKQNVGRDEYKYTHRWLDTAAILRAGKDLGMIGVLVKWFRDIRDTHVRHGRMHEASRCVDIINELRDIRDAETDQLANAVVRDEQKEGGEMNTYFVTIHDRYVDAHTSNYREGRKHMARAFGTDEKTLIMLARSGRPAKITAEQLGNYIAQRSIAKVSSAVSELQIRETPDRFVDLTKGGSDES